MIDTKHSVQFEGYHSIVNDRPLPTEIIEKINNLTNYPNKAKDMKTESNETTAHTPGPWIFNGAHAEIVDKTGQHEGNPM